MPVPLRRSLAVAVRAHWAERSLISRMPHHVRWSYIDLYRHMNYATYLEVMELGRVHWAVVSGALGRSYRERVWPVVVGVDISYRKELKPSQRFVVDTRLVGFDGRMALFEQHFLVGDRVHTRAVVKALLLESGRVVSRERVTEVFSSYQTEPFERATT